ncbi:hypothetical protein BASA60_009879 [Batrachochytrium salamandrivorans]|nr:hypothetical protein BASA60_009879 [Batrachochytrium salamandrivorans]
MHTTVDTATISVISATAARTSTAHNRVKSTTASSGTTPLLSVHPVRRGQSGPRKAAASTTMPSPPIARAVSSTTLLSRRSTSTSDSSRLVPSTTTKGRTSRQSEQSSSQDESCLSTDHQPSGLTAAAPQSKLPILKKKPSIIRPVPDFAKLHRAWETKLAMGKPIKPTTVAEPTFATALPQTKHSGVGSTDINVHLTNPFAKGSGGSGSKDTIMTTKAINTTYIKPLHPLRAKASAPVVSLSRGVTVHEGVKPTTAKPIDESVSNYGEANEFNNAFLADILTSVTSGELDQSQLGDTRSYGVLKRRTTLGQLGHFAGGDADENGVDRAFGTTSNIRAVGGMASAIRREDIMSLKRTSLFQAPIRVPRKPDQAKLLRQNIDPNGPLVVAERELAASQQQQAEVQRYPSRSLGQASRTPVAPKTALLPFTPKSVVNKNLARELGRVLMETVGSPMRDAMTLNQKGIQQPQQLKPPLSLGGGVEGWVETGPVVQKAISSGEDRFTPAMNSDTGWTLDTTTGSQADIKDGIEGNVDTRQSPLESQSRLDRNCSVPIEGTMSIRKPRVQLPNPFDVLGITPRPTQEQVGSDPVLSTADRVDLPLYEIIHLEPLFLSRRNSGEASLSGPLCLSSERRKDGVTMTSLQSELDALTSMEEELLRELENELQLN